MKNYSPLRYAGGKSSMGELLIRIRRLNSLGEKAIAEPFAGGAGASLGLLLLEEAPEIFINDIDRSIFDFWWATTHRPRSFAKMLSNKRVSMTEWRRQRQI